MYKSQKMYLKPEKFLFSPGYVADSRYCYETPIIELQIDRIIIEFCDPESDSSTDESKDTSEPEPDKYMDMDAEYLELDFDDYW